MKNTLAMKRQSAEKYLIQGPHVGDQNLRLPREIYRSRVLFEVSRHRAPLTAVVLELVLCAFLICLSFKSDNIGIRIVVSVFVIMFGLIIIIATLIGIEEAERAYLMQPGYKIQFMKEVANVKPGIGMKDWDIIAARLNPFFCSNDPLAPPYIFYDGNSCYSFFRDAYVRPYMKKKNSCKTSQDPVDEFQPFVEEVIEAYERRVNEDLQRSLSTS